jgi:hypothetical protein
MKRELEDELEREIRAGKTPREVIARLKTEGKIASEKQAFATLLKWAGKGRYSYGVTMDLGWMEDK